MLLQQEARNVTPSGVMQVSRATVKATAKVFDMFATQIYTDKYAACVRELVANAIDGHTAAGKNDTPVKVWLPNDLDPYLRVTDQGIGMSHDFVMGPYMAYTDGSTKDDSDEMIGGWGIGSKSPFAYTDQYALVSVCDGVRSVYSIFKDEDGIPSAALLAQNTTDDPNGVEVSFPVADDEFDDFLEAAEQVIPYFTPFPRVLNAEIEPIKYSQSGVGWGIRYKSRTFGVVMGGVRYPVDTDRLTYSLRADDVLSPLMSAGLDLIVPIGTIAITPSRETLLYNGKTNAAIEAGLTAIIDDVVQNIPTMFDDEPSLWEASKALHENVGGDSHYGRGKLVMQHVLYRGEPLKFHVEGKGGQDVWLVEYSRSRRGSVAKVANAKWERNIRVQPSEIAQVILDDLAPTSKSATISRIKLWVTENLSSSNRALVIRPDDLADEASALEGYGNPQDYVRTSDMPKPASKRVVRVGERPRVRMFEYQQASGFSPTFRDHMREIPYADQPSSAVLVVMSNFTPPYGTEQKLSTNLVDPASIRFVNQGDAPKLTGFIPFEELYAERLAEEIAKYPTLSQALALNNDEHLGPVMKFIARNPEIAKLARPTSPLGKCHTLYQTYVEPIGTNVPRVVQISVTAKLPPRLNTEKLLKAFQTKQWRVQALIHHCDYFQADSELTKLLKDLI